METSFGNAGEISPGYASPWAGPGVPLKAIKWLTMRHGPLVVRPRMEKAMWIWLFRMLRNCTSSRYAINKARMVPLAEYSRDCLRALRESTGIQYDERSQGTLQLFRTQAQLDGTGKDIEVLKQFGVPFELLDREGCVAAEPALARVREKYKGGLRLPGDETGDCRLFTARLAEICKERGVVFQFGAETSNLSRDRADTHVATVKINGVKVRADAYVMALGSYSARWMRKRHVPIPVYPVKGYSLTLPVGDADAAPVSTIMDETYKVAITRLGDRIRVGGTAEISGYDLTLHESRRATLEHSVSDLFPDAGDASRATFWCGLRPMTPDGPPIIGPTRYPNLFVNTGHGTLGWTMACGSGKVLADIMSGRAPDIDASELGMDRYA
jgi:D-amino-acid dehydrogenase